MWQENMELDEKKHADLTIRVFVSIYNCEVDHVKAISNILTQVDNRDPTNMLWQILGQMNTSIYRENIMNDLNCLLRMMVLEQSISLSEKICNPTGSRHEALIHTKIHQNLAPCLGPVGLDSIQRTLRVLDWSVWKASLLYSRPCWTFQFSMYELSGCCDSHVDHLHHCLLGADLTCRIASAYFLSYRACDYFKLWPDVEELLWVYFLQLQLTWSTAYHLAFAIRKQVSTDCARYLCMVLAFCTHPMYFAC